MSLLIGLTIRGAMLKCTMMSFFGYKINMCLKTLSSKKTETCTLRITGCPKKLEHVSDRFNTHFRDPYLRGRHATTVNYNRNCQLQLQTPIATTTANHNRNCQSQEQLHTTTATTHHNRNRQSQPQNPITLATANHTRKRQSQPQPSLATASANHNHHWQRQPQRPIVTAPAKHNCSC